MARLIEFEFNPSNVNKS